MARREREPRLIELEEKMKTSLVVTQCHCGFKVTARRDERALEYLTDHVAHSGCRLAA